MWDRYRRTEKQVQFKEGLNIGNVNDKEDDPYEPGV